MLRRQLPAYSPLSAAALGRAFVSGFAPGMDGQDVLRAELARSYRADDVRLFASGTQALQVALRAAMRHVRDDRVALPAFSCFDVASAAVGAQARLRFYDLDPATLGPDLESLRRVLATSGTRVVVVAPLYGYPVDWDAIAAVASSCDAILVEDAAQGHGATWQQRPLGSFGPLSILSFGRGKGWTGGGGGALLMRNVPGVSQWPALVADITDGAAHPAGRFTEARTLTALAAQWALGRPATYAVPHAIPWLHLGETVYRPPTRPRPMPRSASACLAAMWPEAEREATARKVTAEAMVTSLPSAQILRSVAGASPGYLRLPIRLAQGMAQFRRPAAALRRGIAPSYPAILPALPAVRPWLGDGVACWPGAEELVRTLVTLPTHSLVGDAERGVLLRLLAESA